MKSSYSTVQYIVIQSIYFTCTKTGSCFSFVLIIFGQALHGGYIDGVLPILQYLQYTEYQARKCSLLYCMCVRQTADLYLHTVWWQACARPTAEMQNSGSNFGGVSPKTRISRSPVYQILRGKWVILEHVIPLLRTTTPRPFSALVLECLNHGELIGILRILPNRCVILLRELQAST
jgi:hypothetical protein